MTDCEDCDCTSSSSSQYPTRSPINFPVHAWVELEKESGQQERSDLSSRRAIFEARARARKRRMVVTIYVKQAESVIGGLFPINPASIWHQHLQKIGVSLMHSVVSVRKQPHRHVIT